MSTRCLCLSWEHTRRQTHTHICGQTAANKGGNQQFLLSELCMSHFQGDDVCISLFFMYRSVFCCTWYSGVAHTWVPIYRLELQHFIMQLSVTFFDSTTFSEGNIVRFTLLHSSGSTGGPPPCPHGQESALDGALRVDETWWSALSSLQIYQDLRCAGAPSHSCGALFIYFAPGPLKHPESATAGELLIWLMKSLYLPTYLPNKLYK